ncbi:mannitol dehydrogenase family protein [Martelella lutilitoris]|uniref:Mannitol dehydrogenase family protein n=1 Tax=Martelella lutilitoris TaxID=2583532 RepID=A0A5C4JUV9_9HYPH|nr:mannitol dehydrogenase family protein [Martelella lutilitoris]TNB48409.1 mannitol dehydrogenase family protein [Martelella lutilitoris]
MLATPIVQFGTSRFLQAHADLFISEALKDGRALGPITVVQTSGDPGRAKRLKALAVKAGFDVRVRGLLQGTRIDDVRTVTSVSKALSTDLDRPEVERVLRDEAEIILSNTTEHGFLPRPADGGPTFSQAMSFPAKLAHLLFSRFAENARPLQIMPCELLHENGAALKAHVLPVAERLSADYARWLETKVLWVNSLVDRIVSEPLEPAGAVTEPYALWAIEACVGLTLPCAHPALKVVGDLGDVETMKLFILNLGHTYLVENWRRSEGGQAFVRELMDDKTIRKDLFNLYMDEVLPAFAAEGRSSEADRYIDETLDRFANPYLDHRLADIARNHAQKVELRIGGFLSFANHAVPGYRAPRLEAILARHAE